MASEQEQKQEQKMYGWVKGPYPIEVTKVATNGLSKEVTKSLENKYWVAFRDASYLVEFKSNSLDELKKDNNRIFIGKHTLANWKYVIEQNHAKILYSPLNDRDPDFIELMIPIWNRNSEDSVFVKHIIEILGDDLVTHLVKSGKLKVTPEMHEIPFTLEVKRKIIADAKAISHEDARDKYFNLIMNTDKKDRRILLIDLLRKVVELYDEKISIPLLRDIVMTVSESISNYSAIFTSEDEFDLFVRYFATEYKSSNSGIETCIDSLYVIAMVVRLFALDLRSKSFIYLHKNHKVFYPPDIPARYLTPELCKELDLGVPLNKLDLLNELDRIKKTLHPGLAEETTN